MTAPDTLALANALIAQPSVTPDDQGCQALLIEQLSALGFSITRLNHGAVHNFYAERGHSGPCFAFCGHTDVVPPGPATDWHTPPFTPTVIDNTLYGRGAADMKGAIAAMVSAVARFITQHPNHPGKIGFLITSDEEGPAIDGTQHIVAHLKATHRLPTWCLVGEASSEHTLGDTLKVGRRGSLHGHLTVHGKQGHIAYPHLAINPIHQAFSVCQALSTQEWDTGDEYFQPTSLQFHTLQAGSGATNVIPSDMTAVFNVRYGPSHSAESLKAAINAVIEQHNPDLNYTLTYQHSASPFFSEAGKLTHAAEQAIATHLQITPTRSTGGGTSDGRFIAPLGVEVIELGPSHQSIHQANEHIDITALHQLSQLYESILEQLLS